MKSLNTKTLRWICICLGTVEVLSFIGFFMKPVQAAAFALVMIFAVLATLKDIKYGLWLIIIELVIGSHGYLLYAGSVEAGISLRMALWIVVMSIWLARTLTNRAELGAAYHSIRQFRYLRPILLLAAAVMVSAGVGWLLNDAGFVMIEAKRWLFALIVLPFIALIRTRRDVMELLTVAAVALAWLCLKGLVIVYIFSHGFMPLMLEIYTWTRYHLLGEITRMPSGFSRVFMQSQIFLVPALFAAGAVCLSRLGGAWRRDRLFWLAAAGGALVASLVAASLSRSFWIGTIAGLVVGAWTLGRIYCPTLKKTIRSATTAGAICLTGVLLLFSIVAFPFPEPSFDIDASLLTDRATNLTEAGAAARWSLLPVIWQGIVASPVIGFGYGKTLTYYSTDPRVQETTADGYFTTYAFEWGWLDIWLKMGVVGLVAFMWLLGVMMKDAYGLMKRGPILGATVFMSVPALAAIHFFTPYLNHPLGFGYLILALLALNTACQEKESIV